MPLYEYQSTTPNDLERSCTVCRTGFELRRNLERAEDLSCPTCKNPICKVPSRVSVTQSESFSTQKAKRAGFTLLHNQGDGVVEKE